MQVISPTSFNSLGGMHKILGSVLPGPKSLVLLGLRLSLYGNDSSTVSGRLTRCGL